MASKGYAVRIYLQDGHADGVLIIARSKWAGRGLVIPRTSLPDEVDRPELDTPGIVLYQEHEKDGQAPGLQVDADDPVARSLKHYGDGRPEWHRAIVFTTKDRSLDLSHFRYLVTRLKSLMPELLKAGADDRSRLQPQLLPAAEAELAEQFLASMLGIIPLLGVTTFLSTRDSLVGDPG